MAEQVVSATGITTERRVSENRAEKACSSLCPRGFPLPVKACATDQNGECVCERYCGTVDTNLPMATFWSGMFTCMSPMGVH